MYLRELRDLVRRQPFQPLRLFLTDGAAYEVKHPDQILVTKLSVLIGLGFDAESEGYERAVHIDPLHITRVEPLAAPTPAAEGASGA